MVITKNESCPQRKTRHRHMPFLVWTPVEVYAIWRTVFVTNIVGCFAHEIYITVLCAAVLPTLSPKKDSQARAS